MGERELMELLAGTTFPSGFPVSTARELAALGEGELEVLLRKAKPAASPATLAKIAARLEAALDLGRRLVSPPIIGERFAGSVQIATYYQPRIGVLDVEHFHVMALNVRHRLLADIFIARGSAIGVEVSPPAILKPLLRMGAVAAVMAHNHPSGDPTPSQQDVELTRKIRLAGEICGIKILDHVVVTSSSYKAFSDGGWS